MPFAAADAADACIKRSRRFLALASNSLPVNFVKNDLRRSALAMAVAAVDAYLHWLVFQRLSHVRREAELPGMLARLQMPFSDLATLADKMLDSRRGSKGSKKRPRPWVQVKNAVQKQLLKTTFQSSAQVETAFAMAGISKCWSRIADKMGEKTEDVKRRLDQLVHRRNQIVHEGDIMRASRPRKLRYNKVKQAPLEEDVDWVADFLSAMQAVAAEG